MKRLAGIILCACLAATGVRAKEIPSVVVFGIDGMDPGLLTRFIDEGRMPHFKALISEGSFTRLETSIPPQSPVAWSNFITGMDPGGHGIFDFIHRDPDTYTPIFSAADIREPGRTLSLGEWILPLSPGGTVLLRGGEAFWQVLERAGVPCTVIRVPANYPPVESDARSLAGMGTPDLLGTYGTFTLFTNDDAWRGASVSGGRVVMVDATDDRIHTRIEGPRNTLRRGEPMLACALLVDLDPEHDAVRLTAGESEAVLHVGEWSGWVPLAFDAMGPFKKVRGMCRFYLKSTRPTLQLYTTPINIDPMHPALAISTPAGYASELARRVGRYYTQGIAEDTKALEAGALSDAEFVEMTDTLMAERDRMLSAVLSRYEGGFLFYYMSTIDQSCHALWRNADAGHPAHPADGSFADRFAALYARADSILGVIRARVPRDATLIVMSDHGFAPYYKKVNLNGWLHREGYLALVRADEAGGPLFENVFWRRTRAYAAGLNGLYLNVAGREARGIVTQGAEYDALIEEIAARLLEFRDPENGEPVVTQVYRARDVYHGPEVKNAPDLVVGYNRGYRSSDDSALGEVTSELLIPNMGKWTGDHCMDHRLVPGILISNRTLVEQDPRLIDLPVTILSLFGVETPAAMTGRALLVNPAR